jgi:hypothetical protein
MARRVDQVDVKFFVLPIFFLDPIAICGCGLNGNTFFSFEIHRVHLCTDGIFATYFVDGLDSTGVE